MRDEGGAEWLVSSSGFLSHAWADRDLSWLDFNRRVLSEAEDERNPLLERVKFLAIFTSNLDEFYMKRGGALRGRAAGESEDDPLAPAKRGGEQLKSVRDAIVALLSQQASCYFSLRTALALEGITLAEWEDLTEAQRAETGAYFDANISPALTPLGFDPTHPFPFISNLSTNWAFVLRTPGTHEFFPVRVKSPTVVPQWVQLHADVAPDEKRFISLEPLIRHNATKLFPGLDIVSATLFRIFRDAEVELEEPGETMRESVLEALKERRFQPVVRIDFSTGADPVIKRALIDRFALAAEDVYDVDGLIDYTDLFQIAALDVPKLRDPPWIPVTPSRLAAPDTDVFATIAAADILVHHPYESFDDSVERFVQCAADDPQTVAIKMTVYRVGDDTPFVRSLIRAAEAGKQVACIVEVKARFDEARNLHWAQALERVGAHVVYGVMGLKTHTKLALVVRNEAGRLRCYAHIGTGNYHVRTARIYTDVGLLTANPEIVGDVVNLFHYFTGRARTPTFSKLLVAPINMRESFLKLIEREIDHARNGRPARIVAKMNQLEDLTLCRALSAASCAGVPIDLVVRGFCCLIPGIPGWTERVRVRSIIGRFLEHSRIFYFANGQADPVDGDYYLGSADWMYRNLSRRVEAATPVADRPLRERLWEILDVCLRDARQAWLLAPDGHYYRASPSGFDRGPEAMGTHATLMDRSRLLASAQRAVTLT